MSIAQRAGAEALGTAFLLAAVVGSGIMGERLAGGNGNLALLAIGEDKASGGTKKGSADGEPGKGKLIESNGAPHK